MPTTEFSAARKIPVSGDLLWVALFLFSWDFACRTSSGKSLLSLPPSGGIKGSFCVLPMPPPSIPGLASGSTSARAKVAASLKMSSVFATFYCEKAGAGNKTYTTSAWMAPSTMKQPGPSASAPFCNFSFLSRKPDIIRTVRFVVVQLKRHGGLGSASGPQTDHDSLCQLLRKGPGIPAHLQGNGLHRTASRPLKNSAMPTGLANAIDEMFFMPNDLPLPELTSAVSYAARHRHIDRIVALDEFDLENVAALREHLRLPGMGQTTMRYFRDKLAMRARAKEAGILVPEFSHILNYDDLREFMSSVPAPWLLKPRSQASGIGMKKINTPDELWPWLDQLGDQQSHYLLGTIHSRPRLPCRWHCFRKAGSLCRGARLRFASPRCFPSGRRLHDAHHAPRFCRSFSAEGPSPETCHRPWPHSWRHSCRVSESQR